VTLTRLLSFRVLIPSSVCGLQFVSITYFRRGDLFISPPFVRMWVLFYLLVFGVLTYLLPVSQDIFSRLDSFVANVLFLFQHFYLCFTNARLATPFDI
jgi:hypothetical protein